MSKFTVLWSNMTSRLSIFLKNRRFCCSLMYVKCSHAFDKNLNSPLGYIFCVVFRSSALIVIFKAPPSLVFAYLICQFLRGLLASLVHVLLFFKEAFFYRFPFLQFNIYYFPGNFP